MAEYGTTYSDWLRQNQQGGLAGMGSQPMQQPQQPAPAPVAPAPVAPAPAVAPTTRNPTRALQEVRGAQVQGANETAASFLREGDAKADASTARAGVIGAATPRARRYADAADATHEANRGRQDKALSWMDQDMETLRKPPVEPERWQKAVGILSGIVGATAQAYLGDMGSGIAYGLNALQDHVYSGVRNQLEEKDEAGRNLGHTEKYLDALERDSANEADLASKLAANHWFATSKELERMAEEAKVPEYRETAQRLAIEAQSKGRSVLEKNYAEQIAQARAAAAAKAKANAKKEVTLSDALKLEEQRLKNEGLSLANEAARVKAAGGTDAGAPAPLDRGVVNPKIWESVNDTEKAKFRVADSSFRAFDRDASKLEQLLKDHGTEAWGDVSKEMESLQASLLGSYKEIKELGALDNGVIEVVDRAIGDPTAFLKGGEGVRAKIRATRESLRHGLEARAGNLGLGETSYGKEAPPDIRTRTPGSAPAPAADPNAPVAMIDPRSGRRYMIPPGRAAAAKAQGLELASEVGAQFERAPAAAPAAPAAPPPPPAIEDVYASLPADVAADQRLAEDEDLLRRQLAAGAL